MNKKSLRITKREWFAAHAPTEHLWIFKVDISDMGDAPTMKALPEWKEKQRIFDQEVAKREAIAWPFVWADAMIEQCKK